MLVYLSAVDSALEGVLQRAERQSCCITRPVFCGRSDGSGTDENMGYRQAAAYTLADRRLLLWRHLLYLPK